MASVGFSISLLDNDLLWTLSDESVGASMSIYHMPFSHKVVLHGCFVLTIGLQLSLFVDYIATYWSYWCSGQSAVDIRGCRVDTIRNEGSR